MVFGLSFRQFVYIFIGIACIAMSIGLFQTGEIGIILGILPIPVAGFFLIMGLPIKRDQPMERILRRWCRFILNRENIILIRDREIRRWRFWRRKLSRHRGREIFRVRRQAIGCHSSLMWWIRRDIQLMRLLIRRCKRILWRRRRVRVICMKVITHRGLRRRLMPVR